MSDNIPDVQKKQLELQLAFCVMSCGTNQMIYYKNQEKKTQGKLGTKMDFKNINDRTLNYYIFKNDTIKPF